MSTASTVERIRIGAWIADRSTNLLEQEGRSIRLEPRAMDVLAHLASKAGVVTSVEDLMATVWKGVVVGDGSVYLVISQLRQALGDADGKSYIETVPKRGYLLTVPVEQLRAVTSPPPGRRGLRHDWRAPALVVAIAALGFVGWRFWPSATIHSVAVLPFADLSADGAQAYFADGVTEEVLNRLAGMRDLRVIARSSSFQLRGQGADPHGLGEKLGVEHLLVGSVRKEDGRVRVTAQLTKASSGEQLWSQIYERRLDDIFAIQSEIAQAVASALQVKLGVGNTGWIPGMTHDVAAYDEYLRGMALNIQMRPESIPLAIAHLQRAVAIDPDFSLAWSGLNAVFTNGAYVVPERADEWRRAASDSLDRARQLTPDAPHVLLALGVAAVRRGELLDAADLFHRLEKTYVENRVAGEAAGPHGALMLAAGRIRDSIRELENARAHDPLAPAYAGFLSQAYLANRDFHGAAAEIDRGLRLDGVRDGLLNSGVTVALCTGDHREIRRRLSALPEDGPTTRVHQRMAQYLENSHGADAEIRQLVVAATDLEKVALAVWAAYYADSALAIEILAEVMPRRGHPGVIWIPLFAEARARPDFIALVERLGMPEYWRAHGFADACESAGKDQIRCH